MPRWARYLIAVVVFVAVLAGASLAAAEYSSRDSFCDGCHEMDPYYDSWQHSDHATTACVDCHVPKGFSSFVKAKVFALREVYVHLTKQVKVPLAVTRDISDDTCTSCHDRLPSIELASSTFDHESHDERCIICHERLVHRSAAPPTYVPPATMDACFACHDGAAADDSCDLCHTSAPHEDRGSCGDCHGLTDWSPTGFDHPFPLTFGHADVTCGQCHPKTAPSEAGGSTLGPASPRCASCHPDRHGGLSDCERCHTPEGWTPSTFRHPGVGEHIPGGEVGLSCTDCHPSGFGSASCSPCHSGTPGGD